MYKVYKKCRLCGSSEIKVGLDLKKVPIGEKYLDKQNKKVNYFPLTIGWCKKCKNVQTMEIVRKAILWNDYTYLSGQTKAIINHFRDIAQDSLKKIDLVKNDLAIDIGSNDGTLLKFFKKFKMKTLGIDPASNVAKLANKNGIKTIIDYFNSNLAKKIEKKYGKAKIITCFNSFAHTSELNDIVLGIKKILHEDGIFIFECQYLGDIYKNKIIGTFFHEHIYHHSITSLKHLFEKFDLNFYDVKKVNIQKGSIIGYVKKKNLKKTAQFKKLINKEKKLGYLKFYSLEKLNNFVIKQKNKFNYFTNNINKSEIGIYGSSRSAPTFIFNYGINHKVSYIFDDHTLKVKKFSPVFNTKIEPTKMIYKRNLKLLIILAYLHSKKIIRKNLKFIKKGGSFMIVYPNVFIINKKNYKKYLK